MNQNCTLLDEYIKQGTIQKRSQKIIVEQNFSNNRKATGHSDRIEGMCRFYSPVRRTCTPWLTMTTTDSHDALCAWYFRPSTIGKVAGCGLMGFTQFSVTTFSSTLNLCCLSSVDGLGPRNMIDGIIIALAQCSGTLNSSKVGIVVNVQYHQYCSV